MNWFKKQITNLMLATSKVEENTLSQQGDTLSNETMKHQRVNQGSLMDSLKQGVITQEVEELRWRMYKVLGSLESHDKNYVVTGYDENDNPIMKVSNKIDNATTLDKVKLSDDYGYDLELVVFNNPITNSMVDSIDDIDTKQENPITIERSFIPKFYIENYVKKLHVRNIDEKNKLIELYVSKYTDEFDRKTNLLISEINKSLTGKVSNIFEIDGIKFITYKSIGCTDFNGFEYNIKDIDSLIEYDGYYIIKYKCEVIKEREYLLEKYRLDEMDEKYLNKEKR
jgi:hypothetical protein